MGLVIVGVIHKKLKWKKLPIGFTTQIHILNFDKFNFCFRNSNYEWDNNYNQNFIFPIEKEETKIVQENFIINEENIVADILDNLFENNMSEIKNTKIEINEEKINSVEENNINNIKINEAQNVSTDVDYIESTNTVTDNSTNINLENDINNIEINVLENDTIENGLEKDIENIFSNLYEGTSKIFETSVNEVETKIEENEENQKDKKFDMDGLINEILAPIANSSSFENITTSEEVTDNGLIDNILSEATETKINTESNPIINSHITDEAPLVDVPEISSKDTSLVKVNTIDDYLVSARSLSKFYILKKRIKFALYKLFAIATAHADDSDLVLVDVQGDFLAVSAGHDAHGAPRGGLRRQRIETSLHGGEIPAAVAVDDIH